VFRNKLYDDDGGNLIFFHDEIGQIAYNDGSDYQQLFAGFTNDEWYRVTVSFRDQLTYNMSFHRGFDEIIGEALHLPFIGTNTSISYFKFWFYYNHAISLHIDCLRVREGTNYGYPPTTDFVEYKRVNEARSEIIGLTTILTISSFFTSFVFILMVIKRRKLSKKNN